MQITCQVYLRTMAWYSTRIPYFVVCKVNTTTWRRTSLVLKLDALAALTPKEAIRYSALLLTQIDPWLRVASLEVFVTALRDSQLQTSERFNGFIQRTLEFAISCWPTARYVTANGKLQETRTFAAFVVTADAGRNQPKVAPGLSVSCAVNTLISPQAAM
jgi:hypothetical protein